jgi:hypothetical protein
MSSLPNFLPSTTGLHNFFQFSMIQINCFFCPLKIYL